MLPPLYPFQYNAVEFLRSRKRSILGLDTGLGKTRVCIELAKDLDLKKVLVVCPAFLRNTWRSEIEKWGAESDRFKIVSYAYYSTRKRRIPPEESYDLIVCDEAHYIRKWSAARTKKIVLELLPRGGRIVLATATPYVTSASDLHPSFSVCAPGKWGKYGEFCARYCEKVPNKWNRRGYEYKRYNPAHIAELKKGAEPFLLRIRKQDVLKDLPPKTTSKILVEVDPSNHLPNLPLPKDEIIRLLQADQTGALSTVRRAVGLSKVDAAKEWLSSIPSERKAVVFCWHRDIVKILSDSLRSPVLIGGQTDRERAAAIEAFEKDSQFLICTMGAAGLGLTLTAADIALFVEMPWNPADLKQCEDRLHRIGQKNPVNIYHLHGENSVDDLVEEVIYNKIEGAVASGMHYE